MRSQAPTFCLSHPAHTATQPPPPRRPPHPVTPLDCGLEHAHALTPAMVTPWSLCHAIPARHPYLGRLGAALP